MIMSHVKRAWSNNQYLSQKSKCRCWTFVIVDEIKCSSDSHSSVNFTVNILVCFSYKENTKPTNVVKKKSRRCIRLHAVNVCQLRNKIFLPDGHLILIHFINHVDKFRRWFSYWIHTNDLIYITRIFANFTYKTPTTVYDLIKFIFIIFTRL